MLQTLRTLIVDDEPLAIERLQILAGQQDGVSLVGTASDGASALRMVDALAPDLVLCDIAMPDLDGLQVAAAIDKLDNPPAVVFVTAHDDFAVEAFDCDAVDYVLKPVAQERLERAVERAQARRSAPAETALTPEKPASEWIEEFWVPHRSELIRVAAADLERIDAERDYVRLHVGQRSYMMLHTIAGLEARLDPEGLGRRKSRPREGARPPFAAATGRHPPGDGQGDHRRHWPLRSLRPP